MLLVGTSQKKIDITEEYSREFHKECAAENVENYWLTFIVHFIKCLKMQILI